VVWGWVSSASFLCYLLTFFWLAAAFTRPWPHGTAPHLPDLAHLVQPHGYSWHGQLSFLVGMCFSWASWAVCVWISHRIGGGLPRALGRFGPPDAPAGIPTDANVATSAHILVGLMIPAALSCVSQTFHMVRREAHFALSPRDEVHDGYLA